MGFLLNTLSLVFVVLLCLTSLNMAAQPTLEKENNTTLCVEYVHNIGSRVNPKWSITRQSRETDLINCIRSNNDLISNYSDLQRPFKISFNSINFTLELLRMNGTCIAILPMTRMVIGNKDVGGITSLVSGTSCPN